MAFRSLAFLALSLTITLTGMLPLRAVAQQQDSTPKLNEITFLKKDNKTSATFRHKLAQWKKGEQLTIPILVDNANVNALIRSLKVKSGETEVTNFSYRFEDRTAAVNVELPNVFADGEFDIAAFRRLLLGKNVTLLVRNNDTVEFELGGEGKPNQTQGRLTVAPEEPLEFEGMVVGVAKDKSSVTIVKDESELVNIPTADIAGIRYDKDKMAVTTLATDVYKNVGEPAQILILENLGDAAASVTIEYVTPVTNAYEIRMTGEIMEAENELRLSGWLKLVNSTAVDWNDITVRIGASSQPEQEYVWEHVTLRRGESNHLPIRKENSNVDVINVTPIVVIPILDTDPKVAEKLELHWEFQKPDYILMADQLELVQGLKVIEPTFTNIEYGKKSKTFLSFIKEKEHKGLKLEGTAWRSILFEANGIDPRNSYRLRGKGGHLYRYKLTKTGSYQSGTQIEITLPEEKDAETVKDYLLFKKRGERLQLLTFREGFDIRVQYKKEHSVEMASLATGDDPGALGWLDKQTGVPPTELVNPRSPRIKIELAALETELRLALSNLGGQISDSAMSLNGIADIIADTEFEWPSGALDADALLQDLLGLGGRDNSADPYEKLQLALLLRKLKAARERHDRAAAQLEQKQSELETLIDRRNSASDRYAANVVGVVTRTLQRRIHTKNLEIQQLEEELSYQNARVEAIALNAMDSPPETEVSLPTPAY